MSKKTEKQAKKLKFKLKEIVDRAYSDESGFDEDSVIGAADDAYALGHLEGVKSGRKLVKSRFKKLFRY